MKTQQEYIEQGEQYILKTYNRFPVVLEKGEGVYLYDADQNKYLDMTIISLLFSVVGSRLFYVAFSWEL